MNTLVDPHPPRGDGDGDGASRARETRNGTTGQPSAAVDAAGALAARDVTLIDLDPPHAAAAVTATLVELAPASGQTLILPEGPSAETRRALAGQQVPRSSGQPAPPSSGGGGARRWLAGARALTGARQQLRLKRLAPFAVGVASLLATGIPLWWRSPRPTTADPSRSSAAEIAPPAASAITVEYPDDRLADLGRGAAAAAAPDQPVEAAGTAAPGLRGGGHPANANPRLVGDRRGRTHAAVSSRWKGRGWVLRTRNGAPVVE